MKTKKIIFTVAIAIFIFSAFNTKKEPVPNVHPVKSSDLLRVASGYGPRLHPLTKTKKFHYGVDYVAKLGTPVMATADGVVIKITHQHKGHGNKIVIKHENQIRTIYAQLQEIKVELGQSVSQHDIIGTVGSSGYSTGPHLHYEIEVLGERVDPSIYTNKQK